MKDYIGKSIDRGILFMFIASIASASMGGFVKVVSQTYIFLLYPFGSKRWKALGDDIPNMLTFLGIGLVIGSGVMVVLSKSRIA